MFKEVSVLNSMLMAHCRSHGIKIIDAHAHMEDPASPGDLDGRWDDGDGAHLNADGYRRLGELIAEQVFDLVEPDANSPFRVLCLGDSITEGYPGHLNHRTEGNRWEPYTRVLERRGVEVINLGLSGDTTAGMMARFKIFLGEGVPRPKLCIILGGTNDLFIGISPEEVLRNLVRILTHCPGLGMVPVAVTVLPVTI